MDLAAFLQVEASLPPYPGACCRMVDKWIKVRTGFSALSRFGRDFESDEDVRGWLAEPGGIAVAVNRVMRSVGFQKTKEPAEGDIGLAFHEGRLCMAIRAPQMWVSRDDRGLIGVPLDAFWKAWSLA